MYRCIDFSMAVQLISLPTHNIYCLSAFSSLSLWIYILLLYIWWELCRSFLFFSSLFFSFYFYFYFQSFNHLIKTPNSIGFGSSESLQLMYGNKINTIISWSRLKFELALYIIRYEYYCEILLKEDEVGDLGRQNYLSKSI